MQRFSFPLQRVLELWERQAELAELRFGELNARRAALDVEQQNLEQERDTAGRNLVESHSVTATELMALESFRQYAAEQLRLIARRQAECDAAIEQQRLVVMEARRRTRLMEKLRERKLAEWKYLFDRELEETAAESFLSRLAREASY